MDMAKRQMFYASFFAAAIAVVADDDIYTPQLRSTSSKLFHPVLHPDLAHSPSMSGPPVPISVVVNTSAPITAFPPYWKRSFGSGHAALTLRPDWQQHLRWAHEQLGLRGVRYHGIFDDDMGVVVAPRTYNFSRVLASWDFQLSLGLVPIVELSFMPAILANCTWTRKNSNITVNPGHSPCRGMMAYNGVIMTPTDWDDWYHLVHALVQTATERYGSDEVRKWDFECWNGWSLK